MAIPFLAPEIRRIALASQGWRGLVAVLALALGVALGYGVRLVHAVAVAETEGAARRLAGEADLVVRSIAQGGMDEALYPLLARRPEVAAASPVLEVLAKVPARPEGRRERLRLLGQDIFRARELQPGLVIPGDPLDSLRPDRVYLNAAAAAWLRLGQGSALILQSGDREVVLQVAGLLDLPGQPLAVMDIGAAQAAFGALGRLTRIDLRLRPGLAPERAATSLAAVLPAGARIEAPDARARQEAEFSRSYRVNLDVLALVALFTGGLLVFSNQALAVVRRRRQFALLRTLGLARREIVALLLAEAVVLGLLGGLLGLFLGQGLAAALLKISGPDLGGTYFRGLLPKFGVDWAVAALFLALGVAAAVAGSLLPALEAARASPARALRAGDEEEAFAPRRSPRLGLILLALATGAVLMPPVGGLPLFGYGAVALFLLAAISLLPWATAAILALLARVHWGGMASAQLGLAQLRGACGQVSLSLAPLVASIAVAAAMAIMVGSFRNSLENWLDRLLPADLYLRAGFAGDSASLPVDVEARLLAAPGVERFELRRSLSISMAPDKPPVTLLVRAVDRRAPDRNLPMVGAWQEPETGLVGAWISEAMADLYGWRLGQKVELPLGSRILPVQVAGLWRDYARGGGAVVVERTAYVAATGDTAANEAAVWFSPGADGIVPAMAAAFPAQMVDIESPAELKRLSLAIFDRTFAATYALEAAAVVVGLAGLSASFAALVLARRQEFGVLRHLGMDRRQIAGMLACQGGLLALVALAVGFALGGILSLILIQVINRQSFHWSMDLAVPWGPLTGFAALVAVLAAATAAASGRLAMRREAAWAVREDW